MVIHTNTGGQRQRFEDALLIFKEQSVLAGGGFSTGTAGQVHRTLQFIVTPFAAEGEELVDRFNGSERIPVNRIAF